jgi:hypothetical protein
MALSRYVLTANVTLPPGSPVAAMAGEPGTGGAAGYGSAATTGVSLTGATYLEGNGDTP